MFYFDVLNHSCYLGLAVLGLRYICSIFIQHEHISTFCSRGSEVCWNVFIYYICMVYEMLGWFNLMKAHETVIISRLSSDISCLWNT